MLDLGQSGNPTYVVFCDVLGCRMLRILFLVVSIGLAAHDLSLPTDVEFQSVTGRWLQSIVYAFTPALLAAVVAGIKLGWSALRGYRSNFRKDFTWAWGILLALVLGGHIVKNGLI